MLEPLIEVKNLNIYVGEKRLLYNLDWCVLPGEKWILFGTNGSGKTTLLSVLAGFYAFSEGSIRILGQSFTAENILDIRKKTGFVSASYFDTIYNREPVCEIVSTGFFGALGMERNLRFNENRKLRKMLYMLNLTHLADHPYRTLSKGERQRTLIARALINDPKILLLDEPCSGLDMSAKQVFLRLLERNIMIRKDMALIYVTHESDEILSGFNKTMLLKQGKILAQGETASVLNDKNLTSLFKYPTHVSFEDGRFKFTIDIFEENKFCLGACYDG